MKWYWKYIVLGLLILLLTLLADMLNIGGDGLLA